MIAPVTHLQSILRYSLEKQREADWLPGRRQKEISKGKTHTEVSTLRLKYISPEAARPSAGPLPDLAPSAPKNYEKSCYTKYLLCTVDNSHLQHLLFSYASAMMLRGRSFSVGTDLDSGK